MLVVMPLGRRVGDGDVSGDWALSMRQTTLEEFIDDNPKDADGIERTALELQACSSVVHKLAPLFKAVHCPSNTNLSGAASASARKTGSAGETI